MENRKYKLVDLKIPNKSILNFYAYYYDGDELKTSILQNNPTKNRCTNIDCPEEVELFMHMKLCLLSYFHSNVDDKIRALMHRVMKSKEKEISFGNFTLWNEDGNYEALIDNVAEDLYLIKI